MTPYLGDGRESEERRRSGAWFLLPIFLGIVGGVIAYFVLRHDDPSKAKNCLLLGSTLTALWIAAIVVPIALLIAFGTPIQDEHAWMLPPDEFSMINLNHET